MMKFSEYTGKGLPIFYLIVVLCGWGYSWGQTQSHRIDFQTSDGVYGYINLKTKTQAFGGARLLIQQDNLVIEGIRYNGRNYTGSDLSSQGVNFPMDCSNCYFKSRGTACMKINSHIPDCASFEICCIHKGGFKKGGGEVEFSQAVKDKHNEASRNMEGTIWENAGYVSRIELYDIEGADMLKVVRAAKGAGSSGQSGSSGNSEESGAYGGSSMSNAEREARVQQNIQGIKAKEAAAKNREGHSSQSYIEKQNAGEEFHREHVQRNNSRYQKSQTSSSSSSSNSNTRQQANQEHLEYLEARAKDQRRRNTEIQRQIQRQIREQREEAQRWEYAREKGMRSVQSFVRGIPQVRSSAPNIASAATVEQAFSSLETSMAQLKRQQEQSYNNLKSTLSSLSYNNAEEAKTSLALAAGAAAATIAKDAEIKKEKEKAQKAFEQRADKAYAKLKSTYSRNYNNVKGQDAFEPDVEMAAYYRKVQEYWACAYNDLKRSFSYSHVAWTSISRNCYQPQKPSTKKTSFTAAEYLEVAKRKKSRFDKTADNEYLEASKYFLNKSLNKSAKIPEAQAFKAEFLADINDAYAQALYAYGLNSKSSYIRSVKEAKEKEFTDQLFTAIYDGNTSFLNKAVSSGLYRGKQRLNPSTRQKETPLTAAIIANKPGAFKVIYQDYRKQGRDLKKTSLVLACEANSDKVVELLIGEYKLHPDTKVDGLIPLEVSFINNSDQVFATLIEAGAKLEPVIKKYTRNPEVRTSFLEMMYDAAMTNDDPDLLLRAIQEEKPSARKSAAMLVKSIVNAQDSMTYTIITHLHPMEVTFDKKKYTYAHAAVLHDRPFALDQLINHGYILNQKDGEGNTPLQYVLMHAPQNVLESKLWQSFDLTETDRNGTSLLHRAVFSKEPEKLTKAVLESGKLDVNAKGPHGWTALHYAARENNGQMVSTLLRHGADKSIKDDKRRTAYDIAKERKFDDLKEILEL